MRTQNYVDEAGNRVGECLPIKAHRMVLSFPGNQPVARIVCPTDGCVRMDNPDSPENGSCWLADWWEALGWEMLDDSDLTLEVALEGEYHDGDYVQIRIVADAPALCPECQEVGVCDWECSNPLDREREPMPENTQVGRFERQD